MLVYQCDFCKELPDQDKTIRGDFKKPSGDNVAKRDFCLGCFNLLQSLLKMDRQKLLDLLSEKRYEHPTV